MKAARRLVKPGSEAARSDARPSCKGLADALFSATQKRVLALIYGQPERSFFTTEVIERVGAGTGAVQRELRRLAESGLVTVKRVGSQKHFQANKSSPIFEELRSIVAKTLGVADELRKALEPIRDEVLLALVYGSVAKGRDGARSDIDLLLVSDSLTLEEVFSALAGAEKRLGRKVNPTVYTSEEYARRKVDASPFLTEVLSGPIVSIIGEDDDLAELG